MQTVSNPEQFWKTHIAQAENHPAGVMAYLKTNAVPVSSFFKWRKKILDLPEIKQKKLKRAAAFIPVTVRRASAIEILKGAEPKALPNAKWVSDILINLVVGLR